MRIFLTLATVLCISACSSSEKEVVYHRQDYKQEINPYLISDSTIFVLPPYKGDSILTYYNGSVHYSVKDIEIAERQLKAIMGEFNLSLINRSEHMSNSDFQKEYYYRLESSYFPSLEKRLDSLFGRVLSKRVSEETRECAQTYDKLKARILVAKKQIDRFNNRTNNQGMEELVRLIREEESSISSIQYQLKNCIKNESTIQITFKEDLRKTDALYDDSKKKNRPRYW